MIKLATFLLILRPTPAFVLRLRFALGMRGMRYRHSRFCAFAAIGNYEVTIKYIAFTEPNWGKGKSMLILLLAGFKINPSMN